jgi:ORF6N domain-containing protein
MPHLITIGSQEIAKLAYKEMPVVTFEQIAAVHGVSVKTVESSFARNKARFREDKHFYRLDAAEANQLLFREGVRASANGITLFTEAGYLLLAKPMRDDTAWEVQEKMIEAYFRAKERVDQGSPLDRYPELRAIAELALSVAQARDLAEEAQARAQAAELRAAQADAKADVAFNERCMTIEEYVIKNGDTRQYPPTEYRRMATWLGNFCQQWGIEVQKVPVLAKDWESENAYPLQAFAAFYRYDRKRPRQITLVQRSTPQDEGGA